MVLFVYAIIVSEFSRAAEANNNETPIVSTSVMATVLRACRACEANRAISGGMVHQDQEQGSGYISTKPYPFCIEIITGLRSK